MSSEESSGFKILLVEDNPMNQDLAKRLLERRGHHPVVASDGQQALVAFKKQTFDLILMDLEMPEMDGFQATREIRLLERESSDGQVTPIIAMTAYDENEIQAKIEDAGFNALITKPLKTKELDPTLRRIVSDVREKSG